MNLVCGRIVLNWLIIKLNGVINFENCVVGRLFINIVIIINNIFIMSNVILMFNFFNSI